MGGVCSGGTKKRNAKVGAGEKNVGNSNNGRNTNNSSGFSGKLRSVKSIGKKKENSNDMSAENEGEFSQTTKSKQRYYSGELLSFSRELKPSTPVRSGTTKVKDKGSFLGKAGAVGLEKAVEVIDTLGSSVTNLNGSGFITGMASRGNKISILAFEVANTIAKGASLFQSLSEENVQFLKKEVLHSQGVRLLVSTDMKELLVIAAADKREELDVFSKEVIRFGNLCKDPQWHQLGRFFEKLDTEYSSDKQPRAEAETTMQQLTTLAQHTSELYHELHAVERFEQDYQRKIEELQSLNLPQKGESLAILHSELKEQRKIVRSLKKKSLWSKNLEVITEKLVDIVTYLHQAIFEAFGNSGVMPLGKECTKNPASERLGPAGLALHYANMINQMDNIASRPTCLPPNTRDALYHGLPISVKVALRSRLQMIDDKEELTITQVKDEMEKTLHWLVPMSTNTTKAHQGFGWVGEWANNGNDFGKNTTATNVNAVRLQTLYHADKKKTEAYILDLVIWLNRLISLVRNRDHNLKFMPFRSPTSKGLEFHSKMQRFASLNSDRKPYTIKLSQEDKDLLDQVTRRRLVPGLSKSQEFATERKIGGVWALSRSVGHSPVRASSARKTTAERRSNMLDVMDGLDFALTQRPFL